MSKHLMKAVGYVENLAINEAKSLEDIEVSIPEARGRDLLVKISAIAVNPVDYKVRAGSPSPTDAHKIIGWDAVGEVVSTGEAVEHFQTGDLVYYAGDITRQGTNAEYQVVDERIVGKKPQSLSNAEAAAMPLTTITAWELLFDHLGIQQQQAGNTTKTDDVILVVGAAGGVGSILIQIAKALTGATIIATASRDETRDWVLKLGADHVINHREALLPQIQALGFKEVTHIASLNNTEGNFDIYPELLAPFGRLGFIDDPKDKLDVMKLKSKSQSLHIELMFARSMHSAADIDEQHALLNRVAELVDSGHIKTTVANNFGTINADNLKKAHALLESGKSIGKIVLEGF